MKDTGFSRKPQARSGPQVEIRGAVRAIFVFGGKEKGPRVAPWSQHSWRPLLGKNAAHQTRFKSNTPTLTKQVYPARPINNCSLRYTSAQRPRPGV